MERVDIVLFQCFGLIDSTDSHVRLFNKHITRLALTARLLPRVTVTPNFVVVDLVESSVGLASSAAETITSLSEFWRYCPLVRITPSPERLVIPLSSVAAVDDLANSTPSLSYSRSWQRIFDGIHLQPTPFVSANVPLPSHLSTLITSLVADPVSVSVAPADTVNSILFPDISLDGFADVAAPPLTHPLTISSESSPRGALQVIGVHFSVLSPPSLRSDARDAAASVFHRDHPLHRTNTAAQCLRTTVAPPPMFLPGRACSRGHSSLSVSLLAITPSRARCDSPDTPPLPPRAHALLHYQPYASPLLRTWATQRHAPTHAYFASIYGGGGGGGGATVATGGGTVMGWLGFALTAARRYAQRLRLPALEHARIVAAQRLLACSHVATLPCTSLMVLPQARSVLLLTNPASGAGHALTAAARAEACLRVAGMHVMSVTTTHAGHAAALLQSSFIESSEARVEGVDGVALTSRESADHARAGGDDVDVHAGALLTTPSMSVMSELARAEPPAMALHEGVATPAGSAATAAHAGVASSVGMGVEDVAVSADMAERATASAIAASAYINAGTVDVVFPPAAYRFDTVDAAIVVSHAVAFSPLYTDLQAVVSGDGMVAEVLEGLTRRADWQRALAQLCIAHVPAGSGNGLAASVAHASRVRPGVRGSVALILEGCVRAVDALTAEQAPPSPHTLPFAPARASPSNTSPTRASPTLADTHTQPRTHDRFSPECGADCDSGVISSLADSSPPCEPATSATDAHAWAAAARGEAGLPDRVRMGFLSLSWALIADVDLQSERLRWLGGARFTVAAVLRLLRLRGYHAVMEVLPHTSSTPISPCGLACAQCSTNNAPETTNTIDAPEATAANDGIAQLSAWLTERAAVAAERAAAVVAADTPALDTAVAWPAPSRTGEQWVRHDHRAVQSGGDGRVMTLLWAMNVTHGARDAYSGPGCHLSDGALDVMWMTTTERAAVASALLAVEDGGHVRHPSMNTARVRGLRLDPTHDCKRCSMSFDGERMAHAPVEIRVWPGVLNVICRSE